MDEEKVITVGLYFEVKDSALYGGTGSVGYANTNIEFKLEKVTGESVKKYVDLQMSGIANLCDVPIGKVRLITRTEYEENTDDDNYQEALDE